MERNGKIVFGNVEDLISVVNENERVKECVVIQPILLSEGM